MSTPYSDIFDVFLSLEDDQEFSNLSDYTQDELMLRYLRNAIPRFSKRCKNDLSNRDDTSMTFDSDLSEEEMLILGSLMLIEYLNPKIVRLNNIKQAMSNRDFQITSQAAHLKQLMDLQQMKKNDVQQIIRDYTYNNNDLSGLR